MLAMATRNWRQVLADAAHAVGAAGEAANGTRLVEAIASAPDGADGDRSAAVAALRGVLAALEGSVRTKRASWDAAMLGDVRAALKVLPRLIEELEVGAPASAIAEHLTDLALAAAAPSSDGAPTAAGWRCPRCGSHQIDEQHTDGAPGGRYVELLCEACSFYGSFHHGVAEEARWRG